MRDYKIEKVKEWNEFDILDWYRNSCKTTNDLNKTIIKYKNIRLFQQGDIWKLSPLEKILLQLEGYKYGRQKEIEYFKEKADWYSYCIKRQPRVS